MCAGKDLKRMHQISFVIIRPSLTRMSSTHNLLNSLGNFVSEGQVCHRAKTMFNKHRVKQSTQG